MNGSPSLQFDIDSIREIAQLLRESELGEICLETTDENDAPARLRLKRAGVTIQAAPPAPAPVPVASAPASAGVAEEAVPGESGGPASFEITSHAVGVFRDAKVPVQVGDVVKPRQVLGSVESLRVPNEIVAPSAGKVLAVSAQHGQGIEYGQTLFVIQEA